MKKGPISVSGLLGAPLFFFLVAVPLALVIRGHDSFASSLSLAGSTEAIRVSLRTTSISLAVLIAVGTPLAAGLVRVGKSARVICDTLIDLPLVLPPAAAGIGLLVAFGRHGLFPTGLPFTMWAVVASQVFVSAPLYIRAAVTAFSTVPDDILETAQTEGAGPIARFFSVTLPLSAPIFMGGAAMAWARGLGEFGATILFAGSLEGKTETLPLAIYLGFEENINQAIGLSLLLLVIAVLVLGATRLLLVGAGIPSARRFEAS